MSDKAFPSNRRSRRTLIALSSVAIGIGTAVAHPSIVAQAAGPPAAKLFAWGRNNPDGQLGNNSTTNSSLPVATLTPSGVTFNSIAAGGDKSLALDTSGTAWAWGDSTYGQLGTTTGDGLTPSPVSMPAGRRFGAIAAGGNHSLALDTIGNAWGWGYNVYGQVGNGSSTNAATPAAVTMPLGVTFTTIAGGGDHSLALDSSRNAWAWGRGIFGELGNGSTANRSTPVSVTMPSGVTFTAISGGYDFSLALDSAGKAWTWGDGVYGVLGNGSSTNSSVPVPVTMPSGVTFKAVSAGGNFSMALDTTGKAWTWGDGLYGELGNGSTTSSSVPVPVSMPSGVTFTAIASSISNYINGRQEGGNFGLAVDQTEGIWSWGQGLYGQLGTGSTNNSSIPARVRLVGVTVPIAAGANHALSMAVAVVGSSFCVPGAGPTEVNCTLYESRAGAPSELSDVVPIPNPPGAVPSGAVAVVQNPNLPQTDPTNWSDVVEFLPAIPGAPPGSPSQSVEQLSEGCGNPNNPFDVSCYPPASAITQFVVEVQSGQGNDFTDCTPFVYVFQGQPFGQINACSDAALNEAPNPDVPEAPLAPMLPLAALGVVVAGYGWRRRTSSRV